MRKTAAVLAGIAILSLSGMAFGADIVMNGSTTVLPIAEMAAEGYEEQTGTKVLVSGLGSSAGIEAVSRSCTPMSAAYAGGVTNTASRPSVKPAAH